MHWGMLILVHAIGIPLVYHIGKACGMKKDRAQVTTAINQSVTEMPGE